MLTAKKTLLRVCDMIAALRDDKIPEPSVWHFIEELEIQPELQLGEQLFFDPMAVNEIRQAMKKARQR